MSGFGQSNLYNIQGSNLRQSQNSKLNMQMTPSQLVQRQLKGNILDEFYKKPQIKNFLNLADYSIYTQSDVAVDEPLFEPIPPLIQFIDYEPLQMKEKIFKLRNKDKVARRVKIIQPDSRLFQVIPAPSNQSLSSSQILNQKSTTEKKYIGNKIAPGMEATFIIKFSPEAKIDYHYDLIVVTEREEFIVPIYAIGKRAMIEFPDFLDFGQCPVKYLTEKPIIIRNIGEKTTKWSLTLPQEFEVDKKEGVLEYEKNEQIILKFFPKETQQYKNKGILEYDGLKAYFSLKADVQNHLVYLSTNSISLEESYIGLKSQGTVKIFNKSPVKIDFEWRTFQTEKEELDKKHRLKQQLKEEEAEEKMLLKEIVNNEKIQDEEMEFMDNEGDSEEEPEDEKTLIEKIQKKADLMLTRKYKDIHKAIEDDLLLFQDDIFSIQPISGSIWPNSEITITVTFTPKGQHYYRTFAFCNISCKQQRLELELQGDGIGPKAELNQTEINLGDPFVNEEVNVMINIENKGDIDCKFDLIPNERHFGKMFKFSPENGLLKVSEKRDIKITFCSSKPGEFKEMFKWKLHGSNDLLSVLFIGHIRAPQFEFDKELIDFGKVSYNFPQEQRIKLMNKSTVPFDYVLRIPGDGKGHDKEFVIERSSGNIKAGDTIESVIIFTPKYTKNYDMVLTIDIEGVAQDMKCLSIKAESEVPQVEMIPQDKLDFGEIFLKHSDIREVKLINNSMLKAKFEVQEQKKECTIIAKYEANPSSGIIQPGKDTSIKIKLTTNTLGDISLPLGIVIVGSNSNLPYIINIAATSIGPKVEAEQLIKEIDFGSVNVLQDYVQKIKITNKSLIQADFRAFTKNKVSIFKPLQKHGILQPQESLEVPILCNADDAAKFQDILHFVIEDGADIDIVLKAKGVGKTIFCERDLSVVDFQTLYTFKKHIIEIFVQNKGRKSQKLTWVRRADKKKQINDEQNQKKSTLVETGNSKEGENAEENHVFSIVPDNVVLPAKHGIIFQFRAYSTRAGIIPEQFVLNTIVGSERKTNEVYQTTVQGDFIKPTLRFSEKSLYFKYKWEKNVPFSYITKTLTITCVSLLKTSFLLKVEPPFSIDREQFTLQHGETAEVKVQFDPSQKVDRISGFQKGKLLFIHLEHPHKDIVELVGELCFPNVKLEQTVVNFGSILNETQKKIILSMGNMSEMGVNYQWSFVEESLIDQSQQNISNNNHRIIPINEVFDILPLSGHLESGEIENVQFIYNSYGGQKFKTIAICNVEGGPKYEIDLIGDSSLISYRVSSYLIDIGELRFCEWTHREFFIENIGKVTFDYKISLDNVKRKSYLECTPLVGKIAGGEKQKISIRVCPVMPNEFKEIIQLQIGYCEPENIIIQGKGYYPSILVSLDREQTNSYKQKYHEEFEKKKNEREQLIKRAQLLAKASEQGALAAQNIQIKSIEDIQNSIYNELDRQLFCTFIQDQLEENSKHITTEESNNQQHVKTTTNTSFVSRNNVYEKQLYQNIILTNYVCDFGNVVLNSIKQKTVKIMNLSNVQIELLFDTKNAKAGGFQLPEKPPKIPPHGEITIKISFSAKNKVKYGKNRCQVPVDIKNGAKYVIDLVANITIPEIIIENMNTDTIDFGKVLCGQKKTIYIRLINDKEIPCIWSLNTRADLVTDKKKDDKFQMIPTNGTIQSNCKQIIQISFFPNQEKPYEKQFILNIVDNPKNFKIHVVGQGSQINLEFIPSSISIGPVLPYEGFAHAVVEVKNPNEYDALLYSLDFDKQYLQDEETLQQYPEFEKNQQLFVKVRQPDDPLWPHIEKGVQKMKQIQALQDKLQKTENAEEKQNLEKQIENLLNEGQQIEYPQKVDEDKLHHLIIIGSSGCGKTASAKYMQSVHKRYICTVDDIIDWCIQNGTPAGLEVQKFIQERQNTEMENINIEREKQKKKAGKKAPELEAKWGPINEKQFLYITEEHFEKCFKDKIQQDPACNAGIIFDGINSKYMSSQLFALKCIMKAVNNQSLQLLFFHQELDEEGLEVWKLIEWEGMDDIIKNQQEQQQQQGNQKNQRTNVDRKARQKQKIEQENNAPKKKKKSNDEKENPPQEQKEEQEVPLFEVFEPKAPSLSAQELEIFDNLIKLFSNEYKKKIENPTITDPAYEELKKEEKKAPPKKDAKGKIVEEEVIENDNQANVDYTDILMKGPRLLNKIPFHYNFPQLFRNLNQIVPTPIYPDHNTMPIPQPEFHQILTKPQRNIQKKINDIQQGIVIKHFEILTPIKDMYRDLEEQEKPQNNEEKQENKQENERSTLKRQSKEFDSNLRKSQKELDLRKSQAELQQRKSQIFLQQNNVLTKQYDFKISDLQNTNKRWVIPANKILTLVVRFFAKNIGNYDAKLEFENYFSQKRYQVEVKGICDFPIISQLSKNIYWQVKKQRPLNPPESYLHKVYVQSENIFDFGPLLIGKNAENRHQAPLIKTNSTTFRISNTGKYDANIEFSLLSSITEEQSQYKKGVFIIEPESMNIAKNDVPQELRVWAIPDTPQIFKDEIIVMIKNNPTPVILPIQCIGCKPVVTIEEGQSVKFDRLLLNQSAKKEIKIKNNGQIPCRWKLSNIQNIPKEFTLNNTEGELKPTQETIIHVQFKAIKQQKLTHQIFLEVEDVEGLNIKQETKEIQLDAEAFDISVELKFPENNIDNLLDFGAIRVGDIKDCFFTVKNTGLYKVQFKFCMKKKLFKENFKIEPQEVELETQQEKQILVRFQSQREIKMHTNNSTTDIIMEILEGKTLELYKPVPVNVKVNSVFSKYSIFPLKNINFSAIQFNESKTLSFEIKNEGLFEYNYTIFNYYDDEFRVQLQQEQEREREERIQQQLGSNAPVDPKKQPKKDAKNDKKPPEKGKGGKQVSTENQLKISQWTITPCKGSILPDSSVVIEVEFKGNSQRLYEQKLAIDISGRDPNDQSKGILYELIGESCIPGINCDNFETIFEEQIIVASQNSNQNITSMINSNVFFYEEKTFYFGTLIPSQHPDGICEKFKIINQNKIPCTVKFDVRKRNPNSPELFAFEIAQKSAKIHPHEHIYVKIFFKPTIMAVYTGIFEAIVENGEQNPKTHKLVFDLRGEGALPTIKLEKPKEWLNDQTPFLKFPKVRIDKSLVMPIIIKNEGQMPATVKWDLVTNPNFRFQDQNSFTLTPKTYKSFNVEFKPTEPGQKQWQITMQTLLNPYEVTRFLIQGEGFYEDIVFEKLPNESEDEINFGDCIINVEKKVNFYIKNNKQEPIKFQWNTQGCEDFIFSPSQGHLAPRSTKHICLTFKAQKSTTHKNFQILLETKSIKQNNDHFFEWDDSITNPIYVTQSQYQWILKKKEEEEQRKKEEELLAQQQKNKGGKKAPPPAAKKGDNTPQVADKNNKPPPAQFGEVANIVYHEPVPEPEHIQIEKTEKNITLKVSAISDLPKYDVETREIFFKPTLMYTSRTHNFYLKNTSLININYSCKIISYVDNIPIIDPSFFYVNPKTGSLAPNCSENFTVRFSPTEVLENNERFLLISIENLPKNEEPLIIELNGEAERPICHFELPQSNYREKKPELDSSYNVIEFSSLGTRVKNTKKFYVVNPTVLGYDFEWKNIQEDKLPAGANIQNETFFKCQTQKGIILSGKKYEMTFDYTPDIVGTHESYWQFEIPSQNIVQNFLIVGNVIEPNVFFDVGKVNFGPLLLGGKNKETVKIQNLEDVPMTFSFDKSTVKGDPEYSDCLKVVPINGTINPQSFALVEISFFPKVEMSFNYNLLCNISRKSRPISLNVKGIGYILHHTVNFQNNPGTVLDPNQVHYINMGDIYVNEKTSKIIEVQNQGEFNFDFTIKKSQQHLSYVQILQEHGTVKQGTSFQIEVKFLPISETVLTQQQSFTLNISSGPTYTFILQGSAKKPGVELSFLSYDFGIQFVLKQPLPVTAYLEMRNRDVSAMSIETLFEKSNYLDINLSPGQVILPLQVEQYKDSKGLIQIKEKNVLKIPIIFTPRECKKYSQKVTFDINGLSKIDVLITGEGVPFKLELENSSDQNIDFGIVRVNHDVWRQLQLVNQSRKPIQITFDVENQLDELKKNFIEISSGKEVVEILPKKKKEIDILFKPSERLHQFKKEVFYKIVQNQEQRKMLNIQGACHGIELKLLEETIGFGVVVINSKKSKVVQIMNLGDVGSKFEWDLSYCRKFFTISPEKGFFHPHENFFFTITFHPNVVDPDICFNKVKCHVENSTPLYINLLGKCVGQPVEHIQELKFNAVVRTQVKQKVSVKNPTSESCRIKVLVAANNNNYSGYFTGKEILEIQPNGVADYEVVYMPLTMTANTQVPQIKETQHEGTLFFPLPDGSAILYNLFGQSTPPNPEKVFDVNVQAKKTFTQLIPIKNWLKTNQRFLVEWNVENQDPAVFVSGANTIDVAGDYTKQYKLNIFSLKQSQAKINIVFKNEKTFEFVHFKINLNVQPPEVIEKIEMSAIIRETVSKLITIRNPLNAPVEIKKSMLVADNDNISFNPQQFTIQANSEFGFEIIYRPLLVKEESSKVTLNSAELGNFLYSLHLKGIAQSTIQRSMTIKAPLGSDAIQGFKFINFCKKQTTYSCRIEKIGGAKTQPPPTDAKGKGGNVPLQQIDFIVEQPNVVAPGAESMEGNEINVSIKFEPSILGESQGILIVNSPEGGEYTCMLNGISSPPQPKGPYKIGGAKSAPIEFRNPFFEACDFLVRIDNPSFTTALKNPVKIDGKKVLSINVAYKLVNGTSNNGRLIIQVDKNDYPPWVFYLQGE